MMMIMNVVMLLEVELMMKMEVVKNQVLTH